MQGDPGAGAEGSGVYPPEGATEEVPWYEVSVEEIVGVDDAGKDHRRDEVHNVGKEDLADLQFARQGPAPQTPSRHAAEGLL